MADSRFGPALGGSGITNSERGLPDWQGEAPQGVLFDHNRPDKPIFPPEIVPGAGAVRTPATLHKPHRRKKTATPSQQNPPPQPARTGTRQAPPPLTPPPDLRRFRHPREWEDVSGFTVGHTPPSWLTWPGKPKGATERAPPPGSGDGSREAPSLSFKDRLTLLKLALGASVVALLPEELFALGLAEGAEVALSGKALKMTRDHAVLDVQKRWMKERPARLGDLTLPTKDILTTKAQRAAAKQIIGHRLGEAARANASPLLRRLAAKSQLAYADFGRTPEEYARNAYQRMMERPADERKEFMRRVFRQYKDKILRLAFNDAQLRADLQREAGIYMQQTTKGARLYQLGVTADSGIAPIWLDVDHHFGLSRAVDIASAANDWRPILSIVNDFGLQLSPGRENQILLEPVRAAARANFGWDDAGELWDAIKDFLGED